MIRATLLLRRSRLSFNSVAAGTGEGFGNGDAVQGAGIFKSTNGGGRWSQLGFTAGNVNFNFVNRLAISANSAGEKTILAATNSGVWRSTDGGTSWSQRTTRQALDIDFLGLGNSRAVVGELGSARFSTDGGVTWAAATFTPAISNGGSLATNGRVELATHRVSAFDSFVYASVNQKRG